MTRYADVRLRVMAILAGLIASPPLRSQVDDLIFADGFDPPAIVINEVESNPVDWIELFNRGTAAVDISGWYISDSDPAHVDHLPSGTILAAGSYYVFIPASFGLGALDSAILYDDFGNLQDSYSWSSHATGTFARCPNGSGLFVDVPQATEGTNNDTSCP